MAFALASLAVAVLGVALLLWALRADRAWWEQHVFVLDCATGPRDVASVLVGRGVAAVAGVGLIAVARPRWARWLAASPRRAAASATRVALAAALALLVSEVVLRWTAKPADSPPKDVPALRTDAHLSYALAPKTSGHVLRGGRDIAFAVNAMGLRTATESELPDLSRPSILIAGESIAQGYAVPYDESVGFLVEQATGVPTLNAAVVAYASDQVYRRMQEVLPELEHPIAVVTFVVPVQIERNVSFRREHLVVLEDGSLAVAAPAPALLRDMQLVRLLGGLLPHDDSAVRIARAIYAATAREVRARGAYPLFVATNYREACLHDESGESSLSARLFRGLDVPHVSVDLDTAWDVPEDGHPDVRGSRALAAAIVDALREARVLPAR